MMTKGLADKADKAEIGDEFKHRGKRYRVVVCLGPAHANPWIDNCLSCAPLWGRLAEPIDE